ncbi:hypothetical protein HYT01_00025 [Candidatus Giovannonibacteria bacterium]|nr:hypothetical protein [Candidatus Giovannonibacteria bacterium]
MKYSYPKVAEAIKEVAAVAEKNGAPFRDVIIYNALTHTIEEMLAAGELVLVNQETFELRLEPNG